MTLPAAGWFPDPQDATRLRWWDGYTWADATRALPARTEPVSPVVVAPVGPSFSVGTTSISSRSWASGAGADRRVCVFALVAVLAAVASVLLNPLALCSAVGVVAGVVGVVRPGATGAWRTVSRSVAASALVVAAATAVVAASAQFHLF